MAKHWSDGRMVVIRPDGMRKNFDPEADRGLKSRADHAAFDEAAAAVYAEAQDPTNWPPAWARELLARQAIAQVSPEAPQA